MSNRATRAKVLYCESNADGTIGGSHYCLLFLVEQLDRTRYEPIVLFYEDHSLVPRFRAVAETLIDEPHDPVRWTRGGLLKTPAVLARRAINMGRLAGRVATCVRFLRERGIALVHLNNSVRRHHDWMAAAMIAGIPCVTHERGLNERYTWSDRAYGRRLKAIIPMSAWIRDHMVARGMAPGNIRVMYDGLDPAAATPQTSEAALREAWRLRPDQRVVGIVGNVREWKGQETVVRAMIEVVKWFPDLVCFFVGAATPGDQPYFEHLQRLVAEAGIDANVRWTGFQKDPSSFRQMMDVVVHASLLPEPFGMVVLEAMAQRKPVIGSGAGGVVEIVVEGETGYTFPPGDWQVLAARLTELLNDPARARAMGERGYERLLSAFTLDHYMGDIHRTYDAVLAGDPLPPDVGLPADQDRPQPQYAASKAGAP
jgi:glycosyltransferase involved in cell wall biosynthesis